MKCSLVANIPSEVLLLPKADLYEFPKEIRDEFSYFGSITPEDKKLRLLYFENIQWTKYKR